MYFFKLVILVKSEDTASCCSFQSGSDKSFEDFSLSESSSGNLVESFPYFPWYYLN